MHRQSYTHEKHSEKYVHHAHRATIMVDPHGVDFSFARMLGGREMVVIYSHRWLDIYIYREREGGSAKYHVQGDIKLKPPIKIIL